MSMKKNPIDMSEFPPHIQNILNTLPVDDARIIVDSMISRKQAEKDRDESDETFSILIEALPIAISVVSMTNGEIFDVNKAWLELTGYAGKADVIGKTTVELDLQENPEVRQRLMDEFRKNGCVRNAEISFKNKLGEHRIVLVNNDIISVRRQKYVLSTYHDITYMRYMENELNKEQNLESIGLLGAGIAHDFNNLLAGLFSYIELARDSLHQNPDNALIFIDKALQSFSRANEKTEQLLTFSKGGMPRKKYGPIVPVLYEALNISLGGSAIRIETNIHENLYYIEADHGQMRQVFTKIFLNARQAMVNGGNLHVDVCNREITRGEMTGLPEGSYITIVIKDHGVGIPQNILSKVFDPYFTTKQNGSGLGLTTAYSIIKKHQGQISIESEPGLWTKVSILLPAVRQKKVKKDDTSVIAPQGKGKILVMDDDSEIRKSIALILTLYGYEVISAVNGEEAISLYKHSMENCKKFAAVILDLTIIGGIGGEETICRLLELDPSVKAIVASGYADSPVLAEPGKYGFKGRILKPFHKNELLQLLNDIIETEDGPMSCS